MQQHAFFRLGLMVVAIALCDAGKGSAQDELPEYLRDRGPGIRTSIFGTYVRKGELLVSPFFEYYRNNNFEYKPAEFGFGLEEDYRGRFRASEGLVFVSYGINDWLAVELEAAVIKASLHKSLLDPSAMPMKLTESGLGDRQIQFDVRLLKENARRPEVFSYFEVVFPSNKKKLLIGTSAYEFKFGAGLLRGFKWGTMSARVGVEHAKAGNKTDLGEFAVEYLKRLSPSWRIYFGVEGVQDEVELIAEAQWHLSDRVYLRLNNAFGLTSKATDWAPDVGLMFALPTR